MPSISYRWSPSTWRSKKRGRNHVARCPFHTEKTPSFNVNEEKQIFMCFGCGVGGDVFKFVMQVEHLTFPGVGAASSRSGTGSRSPSDAAPGEDAAGDTEVIARAMEEALQLFPPHAAGIRRRTPRAEVSGRDGA